jgi:hypothetical protein
MRMGLRPLMPPRPRIGKTDRLLRQLGVDEVEGLLDDVLGGPLVAAFELEDLQAVALRDLQLLDLAAVRILLAHGHDDGRDLHASEAAQAGGNPDNMVLPAQVQQNFAANLPPADAGPVPNFQQQATAEVAKIADPEVKKGLMDKVKDALKNPDHQQTILTAVSTIAGMIANAASLGVGGDAAKAATKAIGTGLLATLNSRTAGKSWADAAKAGLARGTTKAAADQVGVDYRDAKKALGLGSTKQAAKDAQAAAQGGAAAPAANTTPIPAPAGTTPDALKAEWEKFVQFGQGLLNRMVPAQQPAPAAA